MDIYECTCGGLNGNCFRCFGTGLVESPAPIIGRPHKIVIPSPDDQLLYNRARKRKVKKASRLPAATNVSGATISKDFVRPSRTNLDIPACPICRRQMLSMGGLRSHIVSGHGVKLPRTIILISDNGMLRAKKLTPNTANKPTQKEKISLVKSKRKDSMPVRRAQPKNKSNDDIDALDHPSRYPGSFGNGKRR